MPNIIPASRSAELLSSTGSQTSGRVIDRRTGRALSEIQRNTLVRVASVQGSAIVQVEKAHEIDNLTREAMSGQALLSRWAATLAQGDAFLADDLRFFTELAKIGKGEIIADTVSDFCQEGRR